MPWITIPKKHDVNITNVRSDLQAYTNGVRLVKAYTIEGTWEHETTHDINNSIRNRQTQKSNAAYWLNGNAFVHHEPNLTLRDVAVSVPANMRGETFKLYMVQQQNWWNDHPLYPMDELAAYRIGTLARIENGTFIREIQHSCEQFIDMIGYLAVAAKMFESIDLNDFVDIAVMNAHNLLKQINGETDKINIVEEYINET